MLGNYGVAIQLVASRVVLSSTELVNLEGRGKKKVSNINHIITKTKTLFVKYVQFFV
jgi:hypothetical protein